jgi:Tol biopolymer transport system component/DNA-binding winged helix-turn-helix (wHTH) protein
MHPAPIPQTLKFGPYVVDLRAGELRKNGARIRLQEKPLRVLAALAEQQGQIVTREELKKRLWADETFVDFETGLNTAVSKLRDALSDNAEKPRYIETHPRRGYRFVAAVEIAGGNGAIPSEISAAPDAAWATQQILPGADASEAEAIRQPQRSRDGVRIRAAVIAVFLGLAFTIWWLMPLPEPRVAKIYAVTNSGKQDFYVRPATDGVRIFYVQRAGDHYELMQASVNGGDEQKMEVPFRNSLIWDVSPDGTHYLMTSFEQRGEPAPLWSWPATGSPPVKLGDLVSGSAVWSPDGKMIAFHAGHDLLIANADGTGRRVLGTFREEPDFPSWSPDGNLIRFNLNDADQELQTIWEIRPDGGGLHSVNIGLNKPSSVCCGAWTPDGKYFIFADTDGPAPRLWALREKGSWWRRSPRGPFLLISEATGSFSPLMGRDGERMFFYRSEMQLDMQRMDMATGSFTAFLPGVRPVMSSFSRDGQWVAYVDLVTGVLCRRRINGEDLRGFPLSGMKVGFPRWSPDGRSLVFTGRPAGKPSSVYLMPVDGGRPEPVAPGVDGISNPDWGPEGLTIVVERNLPTGQQKNKDSVLEFVDLKNRKTTEISGSENLHLTRWSPDGRFLAAVGGAGGDLEIYDVAANRWRVVTHGKMFATPAWSADSAYVYYQDVLSGGEPLFRLNISSGKMEKIADFQSVLDSGVHRSILEAVEGDGSPVIAFHRGSGDIYGAALSLP